MVYIPRLNTNIIPYYLPPFEDELFTSWIYRMSLKSGIKPIRFGASYFPDLKGFWNRDMDISLSNKTIEKLVNMTPLDFESIANLTLRKYEGFAFEKLRSNNSMANVLSLGIHHRKRKRYGLLYCSNCLRNEKYYRIRWRLSTSIICTKCNCYLLDRCFSCSSPIAFHRNFINDFMETNESMTRCSYCKTDLVNWKSDILPSKEEFDYQIMIDKTIDMGFNHICSYSFKYIDLLLHLCAKLNTKKITNHFNKNFRKIYNVYPTDTKEMFRFLPIKQKRDLLVKTNIFICDLPSSLEKIKSSKHFNNSHITDNIEKMPFWFSYYLKFY